MTECPDPKCQSKQVTWGKMGVLVLVVVALISLVYTRVDLSRADDINKNTEAINTHRKTMQEFALKQTSLAEKVDKLTEAMDELKQQREKDTMILHNRINETNSKVDKVLEKSNENTLKILRAIEHINK